MAPCGLALSRALSHRSHVKGEFISARSCCSLPEDICSTTEKVLLLLIAVRAHSPVDDGEQRLDQTQNKRTGSLPGHEDLDEVQHLDKRRGLTSG